MNMRGSINGGTPKGMVYKRKFENPIKMDDLGVPLFWETPIDKCRKSTCCSALATALWPAPLLKAHTDWRWHRRGGLQLSATSVETVTRKNGHFDMECRIHDESQNCHLHL